MRFRARLKGLVVVTLLNMKVEEAYNGIHN